MVLNDFIASLSDEQKNLLLQIFISNEQNLLHRYLISEQIKRS